jgi:hypothetical protein
VTDPLEPCEVGRKGRHELNAILPDTVDNPAILFCAHCGATKTVSLMHLPPADDFIEAAEQLLRETS